MAATILQRNLKHSVERDKCLIIEMNEAGADVKDGHLKTDKIQPQEISYIQTQIQRPGPHQGSVLSLASGRSLIDQSDVQPLTEIHPCHYDECVKFHATSIGKSEESPFSPLKNFLLYLVIILLILWIIIYTVLSQLKVL